MPALPVDLDPKTDSERAYRSIRDDIVCGALQPDEKLKMVVLKDRYQFGATPLREALSRLAGDKLALQDGQRGFQVAPMSCEDAVDVGRVRTMLEIEALKEAVKLGDDAWEASVVAAYHRLRLVEERRDKTSDDKKDLELWNTRFHEALVSASPSKWIMVLRRQVYLHHERYRHLSRKHSAGKRDTPGEHKSIFEAAINRQVELVCQLTSEHIQTTTDNVVQVLG